VNRLDRARCGLCLQRALQTTTGLINGAGPNSRSFVAAKSKPLLRMTPFMRPALVRLDKDQHDPRRWRECVQCYEISTFLYVSSAKITETTVITTNEIMYRDTGHVLLWAHASRAVATGRAMPPAKIEAN
jgi:hypothetical protein